MEHDKSNIVDKLKTIGVLVATGVVIFEASKLALTPEARREAGIRDNWHCQGVDGEDCYMETLTGEDIKFANGYYVTLAHFKTTADQAGKGYHDPHSENARCLCQVCHITEEVDMDNPRGASKLSNSGVYTTPEVREGRRDQVYITVDDALEMREQAREITRAGEEDQVEKDYIYSIERLEELRGLLAGDGRRRV